MNKKILSGIISFVFITNIFGASVYAGKTASPTGQTEGNAQSLEGRAQDSTFKENKNTSTGSMTSTAGEDNRNVAIGDVANSPKPVASQKPSTGSTSKSGGKKTAPTASPKGKVTKSPGVLPSKEPDINMEIKWPVTKPVTTPKPAPTPIPVSFEGTASSVGEFVDRYGKLDDNTRPVPPEELWYRISLSIWGKETPGEEGETTSAITMPSPSPTASAPKVIKTQSGSGSYKVVSTYYWEWDVDHLT